MPDTAEIFRDAMSKIELLNHSSVLLGDVGN
jgi:hypothetical protein